MTPDVSDMLPTPTWTRAPKIGVHLSRTVNREGPVLDDPLVRAVAMWLVEVAGGPVMLLVNDEDDLIAVYAAPFLTELPS